MTRYSALLEDYARHTELPVDEFLAKQELMYSDIAVGLAPEGDEDTGDIAFFTSLGQPGAEVDRTQLMQLMLEANGLWAGTGGCTLGLQTGTGAVLLCARLPLELTDAPSLSTALQALTTVAMMWREVVRGKVVPKLQVV